MRRIELTKSVKRSNLLPKLQIQVENSAISLGAHISIQMLANQLKGNFSRNNQRNQSIIEIKFVYRNIRLGICNSHQKEIDLNSWRNHLILRLTKEVKVLTERIVSS